MSTTHGQPGLSSDQRSTIRSTILSTRHTLEDELRRQLEKYGIHEAKKLPLDKLTHLSAEEIHTRRTLDAAIERELESTDGDLERSITNYVREATKTYLNRFVALKTIEIRGLVEETITERPEYGNRSYMHHTVAEIAGELTNAPDDGYGAALDLAYQEIGAEIRMIFEESEHTAIELDVQVREEILDELDAIVDNSWESDEALGWVYQYFGEDEREEIDERINEENYKVAGTDIATKTQLFTPRYIVEWMVDNSLGRTWLEMYGERTNIDGEENCFYLAPAKKSLIDREIKPVEKITVLDPACGSGHMLFYAFDVLYQMYLEEGEVPERYIPREILRNNLYGIDIDSGATQIAALSLYLKAKEKSPEVVISQLNIVSADAVLINGERKREVLERTQSNLEKEILEQLWKSFDNIREFGSLIRIETRIESILEDHRNSIQQAGQAQFTSEGGLATQSSFVNNDGGEETWQEVKNRLLDSVKELATEALYHNDPVEEMFAEEVEKTVEIVDLLVGDYSVVVSNPPYLDSGKMGEDLSQFLKDSYNSSRDTYAAFIERNTEFLSPDGLASMITPETFMFNYSFRGLRPKLLEKSEFVDVVHLTNRDEAYMNVCTLISKSKHNRQSRFIRLIGASDRLSSLNSTITSIRAGNGTKREYFANQSAFLEIDRSPFIYWFGKEVLDLFIKYGNLKDTADVLRGLDTGNDDRFVRYDWEIDPNDNSWNRYVMSGEGEPFFEASNMMALWENGGAEIKSTDGSIVPSEDRYTDEGLTYRRFGDLVVRHLPSNWIPSDGSPFIGPNENDQIFHILGYLNSALADFVIEGLNPGLNIQIGDVERIPIDIGWNNKEIERLSEIAVELQHERQSYLETVPVYHKGNKFYDMSMNEYLYKKDILDSSLLAIRHKISEKVFDHYEISSEARKQIYEESDRKIGNDYVCTSEQSIPNIVDQINVEKNVVTNKEYQKLREKFESLTDNSLKNISNELGVSPFTIADLRSESYEGKRKMEYAERCLSYAIGHTLGHWNKFDQLPNSENEIVPVGGSYDENIEKYVDEIIQYLTGDEKWRSQFNDYLGRDVFDWIRSRFFRYYHCKEYRRRGQRIPIYWQIESPAGVFSFFIYYHGINGDTLPKLRGQYLDPRIDELKNELETLSVQTSSDSADKELLKRKQEVQNNLDDIREFRETIDEMIDDGVTVDIKKGIWENIKEWDQYEVLETGLPKLKTSYSR